MTIDCSSGFEGLPRSSVLTVPPWKVQRLPQASELLSACTWAAGLRGLAAQAGVSIPEPAL